MRTRSFKVSKASLLNKIGTNISKSMVYRMFAYGLGAYRIAIPFQEYGKSSAAVSVCF